MDTGITFRIYKTKNLYVKEEVVLPSKIEKMKI